jgi:hypothetical protein
VGLLVWGALSDERTALSFTIAAAPREPSHSRVRVPWDSQPHFTVSDSRLPFLSPPTTRKDTVELFDPASTRDDLILKVKVTLRLTVSQSVSLGVEPHLGPHDQIFFTVWSLKLYFCGAPSLTRGRVCLLYMLLALANAVFLGSEFLGTRDHSLVSQIREFRFRRLLGLAGSVCLSVWGGPESLGIFVSSPWVSIRPLYCGHRRLPIWPIVNDSQGHSGGIPPSLYTGSGVVTWAASYIACRYPRKCLLITRIHGNMFRNEIVFKNQPVRKSVCQSLPSKCHIHYVNITFICSKEPRNSCDSLYCCDLKPNLQYTYLRGMPVLAHIQIVFALR